MDCVELVFRRSPLWTKSMLGPRASCLITAQKPGTKMSVLAQTGVQARECTTSRSDHGPVLLGCGQAEAVALLKVEKQWT